MDIGEQSNKCMRGKKDEGVGGWVGGGPGEFEGGVVWKGEERSRNHVITPMGEFFVFRGVFFYSTRAARMHMSSSRGAHALRGARRRRGGGGREEKMLDGRALIFSSRGRGGGGMERVGGGGGGEGVGDGGGG